MFRASQPTPTPNFCLGLLAIGFPYIRPAIKFIKPLFLGGVGCSLQRVRSTRHHMIARGSD